MQQKAGDSIIAVTIQNISGQNVDIKDLSNGKKTILYLMRDYACVLAKYELFLLSREYSKITDLNAQALFVIQTSATTAAECLPSEIPFTILCDPNGLIHSKYGAGSAETLESLGNSETMNRIQSAKDIGFIHGIDEGNNLQLPAVIIYDDYGIARFAHYGKTGDDVPSVSTVVDVIKDI